MKKVFEYKTEEERSQIIMANTDLHLIEERNLFNGNFLVFTDEKPLTEQIKALEAQKTELMLAVAELANTNETDKIETQLAIAELATLVTGGTA